MIFPLVGAEERDATETAAASEEPWIGLSDIVVIGALAVGLAYWFLFRKPKQDDYVPQIKPISTAGNVTEDDSSFVGKMKKTVSPIILLSP